MAKENWTRFTAGQNRLYSTAEKKSLTRRLLAKKDQIAWSKVHDVPEVAGQIPSRRTLYRLFKNPNGTKIRDSTARQIENLLSLLETHDADVAPKLALTRNVAAGMRQITGTTRAASLAFLDAHEGCFKCIRLTTTSREILVTHLRIYKQTGGAIGFVHIEAIPDEANALPDRPHRIIEHRGFVLLKERVAFFLSAYPAPRQLTFLTSTNKTTPAMSGILLTQDAIWGRPFAARVFASKCPNLKEDQLIGNEEYGLFSLDDPGYGSYLPYIKNAPSANSVLFPETNI